jgi:hypothetical protein
MAESKTLQKTLQSAELSEDAIGLLGNEPNRDRDVAKLSEAGLLIDAVKYLAHTLGGRLCIAWSLSCVRLLEPNPEPDEQQALTAIEKWLADPTDANRRTAKFAAEQAELSTPAGCLAMATFFAEGSIAPPERDHVPVPPHVTEKMAGAAVILAVVEQPEQAAERYRRCLQLAPKSAG